MKSNVSKKLIYAIILILILITIPSYANSNQEQPVRNAYSYDYQKWLELEDKTNTIAPAKYTIPLDRVDIYNKTIHDMILKGEEIPSNYMIATDVPISDQGQMNICWTYTSNLVLQTSVQQMLRKNESQPNYSEKHMDYSLSAVLSPTGVEDKRDILNPNGLYRNTNTGGNLEEALGYWTRGAGPVLESKMPYSNTNAMNSVDELNVGEIDVQVDGSIEFATIYKRHNEDKTITYGSSSNFETTYTEAQVINNRNNMKVHIMKNGGIYSGINMVQNDSNYLSSVNAYINKTAYSSNHAVTIIGWDDNYPASNFPANNKPNNNGAWICANSWGTTWGNNGLFYVSYEDALIEAFASAVTAVSEVNYDYIYQHENGISTAYYTYTKVGYGVNVFEKNTDGIEKLKAVTIYSGNKNATCDIYVNPYNNDKNLNSQNVIKVGTIASTNIGFNTLILENPIKIYGDEWTVIAKITSNSDEEVRIHIEEPRDEETVHYTANAGESFVGSSVHNNMLDIGEKINANVILKARTVEMVSNKSINFRADAQTLKAGQVLTIRLEMSEEIEGTAPTLSIKCGNGKEKTATFVEIENSKILVYKYTIEKEDNGSISLIGLTGGNLQAKSGKEIAYDLLQLTENQKAIADNIPPTATVTYNVSNINQKTNENITATILFNEENVTILNNSASNKYTFENNGTFTFEFQDVVGNVGTKTITINSIDKDFPQVSITENGSETPKKSHEAKIEVTDASSQIISVYYAWQLDGEKEEGINWVYCANGQTITKSNVDGNWRLFVKAEDEAGNIATVKSNIFVFDNTAPTATIEYTEQETTIIATIKFTESDVQILNNNGNESYTFVRNGEFTFKFQDKLGNIGEKTATVEKLTAFTEEDIQHTYDIITGTDRKYMKINHFRELEYDGKYTLSMKQMIQEIVTQVKNESTDDGNGNTSSSSSSITINPSSSKVYTYTSTNQPAKEEDTAKTGMKLKVGDTEYTLVCTGDLNGDGAISPTDVSKMKLNIVGLEDLTEEGKYAADINEDNSIGVTDLSKIKLKIVGL